MLTLSPQKSLVSQEGKKMTFSDGSILYDNTAAAVCVILRHDTEVLLTRRAKNPGHGKLDLPGGFVDWQETLEESGKREISEELGIDIDPAQMKYLLSAPNTYLYADHLYHTIDSFFEYNLPEKVDIILQESEISEALWIPIQELDLNTLAFDSNKRFFEKYKVLNKHFGSVQK